MIAQLKGTVEHVGLDEVVLLVGGMGFRVLVTPAHAAEVQVGSEVTVHTCLVVREDSMTLFAFRSADERLVFEKLQTVSGIGPRIALAALAVLIPDDLRRAVSTSDVAALQRIPGVGKKSAQRMVLEIGDKLGVAASLASGQATGATAGAPAPGAVEAEVRAALIQLGWTEGVVSKTLESMDTGAMNASQLLRAALVALGGNRGR
ncbi:Holliday junction branch migration protein RuvA [Schaalia sp. 19OD2882]|uniref:Holliday junction branch migration protein RuvA n=1 Tax=Schaalia sp. 19OD2882 TaxID=2794089 RepID=UPI001C1F075F|nr:Holliday junction branch migration protein RuvA [Schaalia sp. 19OD2882]QWW20470.1 Holliday junction branch migration protein RuvA [Schaalia sp. 19OD2882]